MNFKANAKYVIVEFERVDDTVCKGGIFIPNRAVENSKMTRCKILSVGPKCTSGVKEGQFVLCDKYAINRYDDTIGAIAEDNIILIEK